MQATTIDRLDIQEHIRWAENQNQIDPHHLPDSYLVAQHPEVLGTSIIYSPELQKLIAFDLRATPWAAFAPPIRYHLATKAFFSYRLCPTMHWEEQEEEKPPQHLIQKIRELKKWDRQSTSLFERDRAALINLIEQLDELSHMLAEINARKLQYQKG